MSVEHTMTIRVRYPEVDAMGYLHHSRYFQYFEMGRVELLRSLGHNYADLVRQTHVRIDHTYELRRGETVLAEAATTIACVGPDGQVRQIPEELGRAAG